MFKLSQRDNLTLSDVYKFAIKLSDAVGGTNPNLSSNRRHDEIIFKSGNGYDCGVAINTLNETVHVFIYSLTPKTLFLSDLSENNLNKAIEFIKSDGQEKPPHFSNTDRQLMWQSSKK